MLDIDPVGAISKGFDFLRLTAEITVLRCAEITVHSLRDFITAVDAVDESFHRSPPSSLECYRPPPLIYHLHPSPVRPCDGSVSGKGKMALCHPDASLPPSLSLPSLPLSPCLPSPSPPSPSPTPPSALRLPDRSFPRTPPEAASVARLPSSLPLPAIPSSLSLPSLSQSSVSQPDASLPPSLRLPARHLPPSLCHPDASLPPSLSRRVAPLQNPDDPHQASVRHCRLHPLEAAVARYIRQLRVEASVARHRRQLPSHATAGSSSPSVLPSPAA